MKVCGAPPRPSGFALSRLIFTPIPHSLINSFLEQVEELQALAGSTHGQAPRSCWEQGVQPGWGFMGGRRCALPRVSVPRATLLL